MRWRKTAAVVVFVMITTVFQGTNIFAADIIKITNLTELKEAFSGNASQSYMLENNIDVMNCGITSSITIDGAEHTLTSIQTGNDSTIYQNANVESTLKNLTIQGNSKGEVGIWEGVGTMNLTDCTVKDYTVTSVREAAIAVGTGNRNSSGTLTLNNVKFLNNSNYDITISDSATVNINEGTEIEKLRLQSNTAKLNIGDNWNGSFVITMDIPSNITLGTIGTNADISGITVSNTGYSVENVNDQLIIKNDTVSHNETNGAEIYFDMAQRSRLYKGSAGFLYGESEINVPTIDLMQGLKPGVMVQKALGGLQHPTGDATRVNSALEMADAKSIQVYLQDIYLEWPYNAPYKADGSLDVNGYAKTCEEILYNMICEKANKDDNGAFFGSDGNYYVLNKDKAKKYSYVLFNEPDNIWYSNNLEGLEAAWKIVYEAVHKIDPDAKCAGPNFAVFNGARYDRFLEYCYNNNCLPEIITWHELNNESPIKFNGNYNSVQNSVNKYYTGSFKPEFIVNEYATHSQIGAVGRLVKWIAMFEDNDMDGCMAYWAMANSLNEMAADQNSPASTWWLYHWYAQMTGEQCAVTKSSLEDKGFYGIASYDDNIAMAYSIFGGNTEKGSKETVYLNNMSETNLIGENNAANVKVYGISYSGQQGSNYKPEIIFDGAVNVDEDTLKIQITDTEEMDAYFAVISPTNEIGVAMDNAHISTLSYEAEDAELLGRATVYERKRSMEFALSGNKNVGRINNNGDGVKFTVNVPVDGIYDMSLFYSMQSPYVNAITLKPDANGQNRGIGRKLPYGMTVDNGELQTLYLDTTISWNYTTNHSTDIPLTAGEHTIAFTQINGDEGNNGNLQLVATIDKIDLDLIEDVGTRYDFEIDMTEQTGFKKDDVTKVTAVAPKAGYYNITGDDSFTLTKQSVDYASDAKSFSVCSVYDIPIENVVYLAQGANTISVTGNVKNLKFEYDVEKTESSSTVVTAEEMTIHGINAYYKDSVYSDSGKVISELGIGQGASDTDKAEDNYIDFKVNAPTAGIYNFAIKYASNEPAPVMEKTDGSTYVHPYNIDLVERFAQIKVNNNDPETVYFRNTMSWDTFKTVDVQVQLNEGENIVKIYNDNSYQFSTLINSTAPEIDTITISKQSYNGSKATVSKTDDQTNVDTKRLDEMIIAAQVKISNGADYSASSIATLKAAVDEVDISTQSEVNKAYVKIQDAISALKPGKIKLADYYITNYASTSIGTYTNSFDGDNSTVWTTDREASPYIAYEVFYAGDNKMFDVNKIEVLGDSQTNVVFLGTNSDDILKPPSEVAPDIEDMAQSGSNTYKNFANAYNATILGSASGADTATTISGKYRYIIVAPNHWAKTNIKEVSLSAEVIDNSGLGAGIVITPDTDKAYADFDIRYDNSGAEKIAYFAAYDSETKALLDLKSAAIINDTLHLEISIQNDVQYIYKAFIWDKNMKPLRDFVEKQ